MNDKDGKTKQEDRMEKRSLLKLVFIGVATLVLSIGRSAFAADTQKGAGDFTFVQLSDTHVGFSDPKINPDYAGTLKKAIAAVNKLDPQPDFVVFTGDLTHTTTDPKERHRRMEEFLAIVSQLKVKDVKFIPGEHDAGLDNGETYKEVIGKTHYTFDHKFDHNGVHFIALDNTSDVTSSLGDDQLKWLSEDLSKLDKNTRIIVLTHRPLFDLYPQWDWWTRDGAKALDLLMPFKNVVVFYGHIHQLNDFVTGHIAHHAAKGLMYALPAPGSLPKKIQIPWDPAQSYKGLGFRSVLVKADTGECIITEYPISGDAKAAKNGAVIIVGDISDFAVGTIKSLPQNKLIIFRDGAGIYAISSECTHLGCTLSYKKEKGAFSCPCHGSIFNKDGVVQRGPANTDLPWFSVEVNAQGKIMVAKSKIVPVGTKYKTGS